MDKKLMFGVVSTFALACSLIAGGSFAQGAPDLSLKDFVIPRTSNPPTLDGVLSDGEWQGAAHVDDFLQQRPIEYSAPSEQTEVWMSYDSDAIYVAFFVHDSQPENITHNELKVGSQLRDDDRVVVYIDPFNNQRGGYAFEINPNGILGEAIFISGTQRSFDWDGIWNGAARIVEGGWTAEMEIPFKTLSFDPGNTTWGVNFQRSLEREVEQMAWYSRVGNVNATTLGTMRGISDVSQGMGLDVAPALAGNSYRDHVTDNSDSQIQPSLDLFYKVTPQINLAVTLNTDFSATEADSSALNSSRFQRYFEEKRAFFLNDFDAFNFGLNGLQLEGSGSENNALAFYSRRIGLDEDGRPVDISGGVKLSGRVGGTEFGTLVMRQDATVLDADTDNSRTVDATDAIVARVAQSVLSESKIGMIYTNGNTAENQDNALYGADFQYRNSNFIGDKSLDAVFVFQQTDDPDFDRDQNSYSASVAIDSFEGWLGGAQYFVVEENYSPGLGFTQRTNAELYSATLIHSWVLSDSPFFQKYEMNIQAERWNNFDTGELDTQDIFIRPMVAEFLRGDEAGIEVRLQKERVGEDNPTGELGFDIPEGIYSGARLELSYQTPEYWNLRGSIEVDTGDYYTGSSTEISPGVEWQVNRNLYVGAAYTLSQYDFPEGKAYTRETELNLEIAFNASVSFTSQIEYDDVRRQAAFNNRLRWNLEPGRDIWVVFNQGLVDQDESYRFEVQETNAAFKVRYTYRF